MIRHVHTRRSLSSVITTSYDAMLRPRCRGVATPVHLGRSMACYEVVITDERDRRVCTCRITCALLPRERD